MSPMATCSSASGAVPQDTHPELKGTGTATELVRALIQTGQNQGMTRALAPLRPTRKHLYPLISIEEYVSWVREDGLPFDPWLRRHVRAGGRVIALAPDAQTMTGSVQEWEQWATPRRSSPGRCPSAGAQVHRPPATGDQPLQDVDDLIRGAGTSHPHRQRLVGVLVDDVQGLELAPVVSVDRRVTR